MPLKSTENSSQKQSDLEQLNILRYDKMNNCYSDPLTAGTLKSGGDNPNLIQLNQKETITQKQQSQPQIELFSLKEESTYVLLDSLARISHLLASEKVSEAHEAVSSLRQCESLGLVDPGILSLKMSKVFFQVTTEKTGLPSCERLPTLGMMVNGNYLIQGGFSPKIESGYTLSDILEPQVDPKYFLSEKAVKFLRLHKEKHKKMGNGFGASIHEKESTKTANTLSSRYYKDGSENLIKEIGKVSPTINKIGNLKGEGGHECHNVHNPKGIAPTVRENHGKITLIQIERKGGDLD